VKEIEMKKAGVNPTTISQPLARYSHGVAFGDWLVSSGQLGAELDGTIPDDVEAQCVLCFENLKAILAAAQMTFDDVLRFNAFVTDREYFPVYGKVRDRYVAGSDFASTLVIVSGFTRPEFKVEVEITAFRAKSA
jgi:2-iminobutanoate/2-iminopropanoate deaminase